MTRFFLFLCALALIALMSTGSARSQEPLTLRNAPLTVCPVTGETSALPDFTGPECETMDFNALDPQGRHLWVQAQLMLDADWIASPGPKGVYLSGLAASEIHLNGVLLGANGVPGDTAARERPGRIDFAAHAPRDVFVAGENTLVLRLSSHHGFLNLTAPMQAAFLAEYGSPTSRILSYYWPSLIMFGVFALGVLVFTAMAARAEDKEDPVILAVLCAALGAQLLIEAARGLISYPYPLHDWRLIGIVASAFLTSLSLMALVLKRFTPLSLNTRVAGLGLGALFLLLPVFLSRGFDGKTWAVLTLAFTLCAIVCGYQGLRGRRDARIFAAGFALSAVIAVYTDSVFIDFHLYWLAGLFLIALFVQQALTLLREQRIRASETRRAEALDTALALARQASDPATLQLENGGRTDFVRTQEITRIQAAGDYAELHYEDGRCVLYTITLARLEEQLPPTFLRVHRSHIVNTAHVETLEREAGGGGRLILRWGEEVPVSRRILPRVRSALSAPDAVQS
ncbi:LytTR family DNA-binding domain-containing protein [Oceanicaulis sp. LC35]|uniref:LytTR family DNA-binding domain-containing protein n=1 Tax=Oceanicaulis sp. LC35 TaxID=3349635 RepID=UPI003F86EEB0